MQVVGQEQLRAAGYRFEQEGQQGRLLGPGDLGIGGVELLGIWSVVWRQAHAGQQHAGAGLLRRVDHGVEVAAHLAQRQAAQAVVGAQGDDDDRRLVRLERRQQARTAAGCGFAGDGDVGDAIIEAPLGQASGQ